MMRRMRGFLRGSGEGQLKGTKRTPERSSTMTGLFYLETLPSTISTVQSVSTVESADFSVYFEKWAQDGRFFIIYRQSWHKIQS